MWYRHQPEHDGWGDEKELRVVEDAISLGRLSVSS